jgi:hypothetical protein
MSDNEIKVGDLVNVLIVGMDGYYTVDEINDDEYTVSQPYSGMSTRGHYSGKSKYKHTLKLPLEKIEKV